MKKIKFGTDGWRAIIAQEFTVDNVARVALATAKWAKIKQPINTSVIIGHDCRFGGELFVETAVKVFLMEGVQVKMSEGFVSTPMISLGAMKYETTLGVIITASHNPASYNGYKLKANFGGPLAPEDVQDLEDMIPDSIVLGYDLQ